MKAATCAKATSAPDRRVWAAAALGLALTMLAGSASAEAGAQGTAGPFSLHIQFESEGAHQDALLIGMAPEASDGYDDGLDVPAPPPPPGAWVQATIRAPAERPEYARLSASYLPLRDAVGWNISLQSQGIAGNISVRWNISHLSQIDEAFALEVVIDSTIWDMRVQNEVLVPASAEVAMHVRLYRISGEPPSSPRDVVVMPGFRLGEVRLSWIPPESDGGLPLRGYAIYRLEGQHLQLLARIGNQFTYEDQNVNAGELRSYEVRAYHLLFEGSGIRSIPVPGTGLGAILTDEEPDPEEAEVASLELSSPVQLPTIHVGAMRNNSSHYDFSFGSSDTTYVFTVLTFGLIPQLGEFSLAPCEEEVQVRITERRPEDCPSGHCRNWVVRISLLGTTGTVLLPPTMNVGPN